MIKIKILLLLIIIFSCQSHDQKANEDYIEKIKKFPDELIHHFPDQLYDTYSFTEKINGKYNPTGFQAKFTYNQSSFEKQMVKLDSLVKYEYDSNDNNLLVINPFDNYKNTLDIPRLNKTKERQNLKSKYYVPVPNFIGINRKTKNKCNLSDDYKIKVVEFKKENKWKKFQNDSHWNLPIGYENGASAGIAVNYKKQTIIYWLSIW